MKRLVLHIGTHKTGSSTIQSWLSENRDPLKAQGVWYGATDRDPRPDLPKHSSLYRALMGPDDLFEIERRAILDDFERSGCETLVLSEEGLSEPYYNRFARIAELTRDFEVDVVCYLRRQDYFLESLWNQRSREGLEARPIADFVTGQYSDLVTRYLRKLHFWSGIGHLTAIAYDETRNSSVTAFAATLGVPFDGRARPENMSPSMNVAALCNLLNRWRLKYDHTTLMRLFRRDRRRHALGRRLRSRIVADYAERNAIMGRQYGIAFDAIMPDEPEEALRWPDIRALGRALTGRAPPP